MALLVLVVVAVAACGSTPDGDASPPAAPAPPPAAPPPPTLALTGTVTVELDDRPFQLYVPESYDPDQGAALVVLLHGFSSSAAQHEDYFQLGPEADRRGLLYALPDGTTNPRDGQFWNATDACCDFWDSGVDDAGYLRRLIDTVTASYAVDPARVFLVGHSNGGFMAYRMACEHAAVVTAVVSLAGAATNDPDECMPERPVSVLQIHGTDDDAIRYGGGENAGRPYPSVAGTLDLWHSRNGCTGDSRTAEPLDLDAGIPGAETTVTATGCDAGTRVELWTIVDGGHSPTFTPDFAPAVLDFLYASTSGT